MNMHQQEWVANPQRPNVGVDVSKQHLDACWADQELRLGNEASGWNELITKLKASNVDLVVVEATGGYERALVCALQEAGLCVVRLNPRQSRDFAKSMGTLAKTIGSTHASCATLAMFSRATRIAKNTSPHLRTPSARSWPC